MNANVVRREDSLKQKATIALALKVKGKKGCSLHFSGNGTYFQYRQVGGNGSASLGSSEEDAAARVYIEEWTSTLYEYGGGTYIEMTTQNTSADYKFVDDGWYRVTIEGRVDVNFAESDTVGRNAVIEMRLEDTFGITYRLESISDLSFSYGDGKETAYSDSGIVINNVENAPKASSHYEFTEGEWTIVSDGGNNPATINVTGRRWITPSQYLMPSIYRESGGAERFYNAINGVYDNGEGGKYTFNNFF